LKLTSHLIPGIYFEKLIQIAEEQGVDSVKILELVKLRRKEFVSRDQRFSFAEFYRLADEIEKSKPIAALGFMLGSREGPLTDGMLGYACIAAPDLRSSIDTYIRYDLAIGNDVETTLAVENGVAVLRGSGYYALGIHERFAIEEWMGHWLFFCKQLRGERINLKKISFSFSEPEYREVYDTLFQCPVLFDQPTNEIRFCAKYLDVAYTSSNETVYNLCVSHCETLYKGSNPTGDVSNEVFRVFVNSLAKVDTENEMAKAMNMSGRTFRRRLREEGHSYTELLFEARMSIAGSYLENSRLAISEISYLVGYSEIASFYRSFKKWSNQTPQGYRLGLIA